MSRSLWIDPRLLRTRGAAFEEIGDEVLQVVQRLDAVLSAEGRWWGDDDAGAEFGKSYGPDAQQAVVALRDMAKVLRGFGRQVTEAADTVESADQAGGSSVGDTAAAADNVVRPAEEAGVPESDHASAAGSPPLRSPDSHSSSATRTVRAQNEPELRMDTRGEVRMPASGADPSVGTAARPRADLPDVSDGADSHVADSAVGRAEGLQRQRWSEPARASAPGVGNPDRPVHPDVPTAVQPGREPLGRGVVPTGRTGARAPVVSARGDRKPSATPWSGAENPAGRPSPLAGPAREGKPTPEKKPASARPRSRGEGSSVAAGPTTRPRTGNAIMQLAQQLSERHGVEVSGFEASDLDAAVVGEFLAAIDDVLTRHRLIDIRGIAIGTVAEGCVVCVGRARTTDADASAYSWSVTLDGGLAADPERLDEILRNQRRPGAAVAQADTRTVYAATVREFGRAFDLAGAGQARNRAQRILIGEYLRGDSGYHNAGLARVVAGYKRWRDQLSGASFDNGQFDAGAALADAFTDVMLNGDKATEPAKTLCGLLTDTAAQVSVARGGVQER